MTQQPKAAILPLYIKLYDDAIPHARKPLEEFLQKVIAGLEKQGLDVVCAPVCRVESEFRKEVAALEAQKPDMLVTVHLAYSPSEESADALAKTKLPILILDTTPDFDFGRSTQPSKILFNHGIHGVQDMANLLIRRGKPFEIVAGHWENSDVLERAADIVRAAAAARAFRGTNALRIGDAFVGMGDFRVSNAEFAKLGIKVTQLAARDLADAIRKVSDKAVADEMALDRKRFAADIKPEAHRLSVKIGLGLRALVEKHGFNAVSANFGVFAEKGCPVETVPFLEASKGMSRGIGYAGEGDILTAALVGALVRGFGKATFTEMFCPDWKGESIFLSHMGEINPDVIKGKARLYEKDFSFFGAKNPAVIVGSPAAGPAVFVNLAPGPKGTYKLILAPVEVLGDTTVKAMKDAVRGWIRPQMPVAEFLEEFSWHGGTHHSALVLGDKVEGLQAMGRLLGFEVVIIA